MRSTILAICIMLFALSASAAIDFKIKTASAYQSSSTTLGSGTPVCTSVNVEASDTTCSGAFSPTFTYRFEFVAQNDGSTTSDTPEEASFRKVYDNGDAVGGNATLVACGCWDDGTHVAGSFSTSGDDIKCDFSGTFCKIESSGGSETFYFVITIGSNAATDTNPDFKIKDGGKSDTSKKFGMTIVQCGDSIKNGAETCDANDLAGQTCSTQGFSTGTLACAPDCKSLNTTGCSGTSTASGAACGTGCCGNAYCEADFGEDFGTCRNDCTTPAKLFFEVVSPLPHEEFAAGYTVTARARLMADSVQMLFPNEFSVKGDFGELELKDDGEGADEVRGDGVFSAGFSVVERHTSVFLPLEFSARVKQTKGTYISGYQFLPALSISFGTNKENYVFGDIIKINGIAAKKTVPVPMDLNLVIVSEDGNRLHSAKIKSARNGGFSASFQTSQIHPKGNWKIVIEGTDAFATHGFFGKEIGVFELDEKSPLTLSLEEIPAGEVGRGKKLKLILSVEDYFGELVEDAEVSLITPQGETMSLKETSQKTYSDFYTIPFSLPAGRQSFRLRASKSTAFGVLSGATDFVLNIASSILKIDVLEPSSTSFAIGQDIPIKLRIAYQDGTPIEEPEFSLPVKGKPLVFSAIEKGVYFASYPVTEKDTGRLDFEGSVKDKFGNTADIGISVNVSNAFSPAFFLKNHPIPTAVAATALLLAIVVGGRAIKRRSSIKNTENRIKELKTEHKKLDKAYFEEQSLQRNEYYKISSGLDEETSVMEKKLESLNEKKWFP